MEGLAHMQAAGTYDTINRMFGLESNTDFSNEMIDGILDSRSWVENTGDTDYWKPVIFLIKSCNLCDSPIF